MKTIDLSNAQELQSVCKEKNITMPESEFYWFADRAVEICRGYYVSHTERCHRDLVIAPAYTLCELLEWLPKYIEQDGIIYEKTLLFSYTQNQYEASYLHGMHLMIYFYDPNPCDACGKLLIWLIKEGLIK